MTGFTTEERTAFDRDGFVLVRAIVPDETIAAVRSACADAVDQIADQWHEAGLIDDLRADEPLETRWASLRAAVPPKLPTSWRQVLAVPAVHALWQVPGVLERARDLIGDEIYAHGVWNGRPREPNTGAIQKIGWHQDAHYYQQWDAQEPMLLSVWMPLVPVRRTQGALQFLPGTHEPRQALASGRSENSLIEIQSDVMPDVEPVTIECDPGDAIFFTDTTVHHALPNESDSVRWSIDIRFGPATEDMVAKGARGYICASVDPDRVESVDTWLARYAGGGEYAAVADVVAEAAGVHPNEVTTF